MGSLSSKWQRPIDDELADRLASPPGESISVNVSGSDIDVLVRVKTPKWFIAVSCLLGGVVVLLGVGFMSAGQVFLTSEDDQGWWVGLAFFGLGILCLGGSTPFFVVVLLAFIKQSRLRISDESFELIDGSGGKDSAVTRVPWADVRDVKVVSDEKRDWRLHTRGGMPYRRGHVESLAVVTKEGTLPFAADWDPEVVRWIASLIAREASQTEPDQVKYVGGFLQKIRPSLPQKVNRGPFVLLGLLITPLSALFVVILTSGQLEALEARGWPSVTGEIVKVELVVPEEGKPYTGVAYSFVVDEISYESDRVRFSAAKFDSYEQERQRMWKGKSVEVWYDPSDPSKAVLVTDFPYDSIAASAFWSIGLLAGLACLIFSVIAKSSPAAEKYEVQPPKPKAGNR